MGTGLGEMHFHAYWVPQLFRNLIVPPAAVTIASETTAGFRGTGEAQDHASIISRDMDKIFSICHRASWESRQLIAKIDVLLQKDRKFMRP
jgi:hypothetical protein